MRTDCFSLGEIVLDAIRRGVRGQGCDCIAMSGGIDTTVVALAARLEGLGLRGIAAYYVNGVPRDLAYVGYVAARLGIELHLAPVTNEYIASKVGYVVKCTGRRDHIEARNDVVFLRALEEAKRLGCKCVLLGDGGDEVFAGYSFMLALGTRELRETILRMATRGRYPGLELAECLGIRAVAPLLSDEVIELVLKAPSICIRGWSNEGKALLRSILRRHGLELVASRPKTPAEQGAGTDGLTREFLEGLSGIELPECHC